MINHNRYAEIIREDFEILLLCEKRSDPYAISKDNNSHHDRDQQSRPMKTQTSPSTQESLRMQTNKRASRALPLMIHRSALFISLVFGISLLSGGCEPPPPCPENHELEGELPPSDEDGLAQASHQTFRGACVIQGPHGTLRDGLDQEWYRGGRVLKSSYTYEGGIRHGEYQLYYPDSTLQERGEYRFGLRHGRYAQFHPNGEPHVEGMYEDGRKSGDFSVYSDNGMHVQKGPYFLDKKHGKWTSTFSSLSGNKITQVFFYHEGQRVISQR